MRLIQPPASEPGVFVNNADGAPYVAAPTLDVVTDLVSGVIESVGPTGSGADNIWTALDSVPLGVDWIEVTLRGSSRHATLGHGLIAFARRFGSTANMVLTSSPTVVYLAGFAPDNTTNQLVQTVAKIPVDENGVFDFKWGVLNAGGTLESLYMILRGYGNNGAI